MPGLPCGASPPTPPVPPAPAAPPGRSLEYASVRLVDDVPVLTLLCDCGTAAELTFIVEGEPGGGEMAWTCDGCGTCHWFTFAVGVKP